MSRPVLRSLSLVALGCVAAAAPAQHEPRPAPLDVLGALSLREASLQSLSTPARADAPAEVAVRLGGRAVVLELWPFEIRSEDFVLYVQTATGITEAAPADPVTMRGRVKGVANSAVVANVVQGGLEAAVDLDGQRWWITPDPRTRGSAGTRLHAVYLEGDVAGTPAMCAADHAGHADHVGRLHAGGPVFQEADIYVDADHAYYLAQGGGLPQVTQAAATAQINFVSGLYESQLGLGYRVNAVYVQALVEQYAAGATGTWPDMTALLGQFSSFWNTHPFFSTLPRDAVHLLSGKGSWVNFVGIANIGVICSQGAAYAVSRVVNANPTLNSSLVAHELGHNWNAQHCTGGPPNCGIMNATITGALFFGPASTAAIRAFASSLPCLTPGADATYTYFGSGCTGSSGLAPQLANATKPLLGTTFSVDVTQCPPNTSVTMILGFSNTTWGSFTLPLDLRRFGMPGCSLLTSIDNQFGLVADASGVATFTSTLPAMPSFVGFCYWNQAQVLDPPANPFGATMSNGGAGVIGTR